MSVMRALVWQEWRDQRRVVYVTTVIAMLACLAVRYTNAGQYDSEWVTTIVLPLLAAVFLGIGATDMLVCPERNGRPHMHSLLPVSTPRVLAAKVAYLLVAATAFLLVLALFNAWLVSGNQRADAMGGPGTLYDFSADFFGHLMLLVVILFASAVLYFSALLQRRSVAICCGALVFTVLGYLAFSLRMTSGGRVTLAPIGEVVVAWMAGTNGPLVFWGVSASLIAAAAGGALIGFRPEWVLEGRTLRRVVSATVAAAVPIILTGSAAAISINTFVHLEPFSEEVWVHELVPSPDGGEVAMFVHRQGDDESSTYLASVMVLNIAEGTVAAVPAFGVWPLHFMRGSWEADDTVPVASWSAMDGAQFPARLDLHSGELLRISEEEGWAVARGERNHRVRSERMSYVDQRGEGYRNELSWDGGNCEVICEGSLAVDKIRLIAYGRAIGGGLFAQDMRTNERKMVVESEALGDFDLASGSLSPGGQYSLVRATCGARLFRLVDGVDVTPFDFDWVTWDPRSTSDRYALVNVRNGKSYICDLVESKVVDLGEITASRYLSITNGSVARNHAVARTFSLTAQDEVLFSDGVRVYQVRVGETEPRVIYEPRALTAAEQELVTWE